MFTRLTKLIQKLTNKEYREAYVEENVRVSVAHQIRALRVQRGWTQKRLSDLLGKPQSVTCRIENPDYGKLSVQTLLEVAAAFDVALLIQYVSFPEFLRRTRNVSPIGLHVDSFDEQQLAPSFPGNIPVQNSRAIYVSGPLTPEIWVCRPYAAATKVASTLIPIYSNMVQ